MRNFARINNYYNRLEAVNDWLKLCRKVVVAGMGDLAVKHAPPEGAGWRKIDKHIAALCKEFEAAQHSVKPIILTSDACYCCRDGVCQEGCHCWQPLPEESRG